MRKPPKSSTVKGKINAYAYKCGFTFHPKEDGTFALFDIHMGYYVCCGSHDRIVQFVMDELWAKYYRSQPTPVQQGLAAATKFGRIIERGKDAKN